MRLPRNLRFLAMTYGCIVARPSVCRNDVGQFAVLSFRGGHVSDVGISQSYQIDEIATKPSVSRNDKVPTTLM